MKLGYSILMRDLVPAGDIAHGDCADFQVVCPCCQEPVFKVERTLADRQSHFLSHYAATLSDVQVCEQRVGSMTTGDRDVQERTGREQRLRIFLRFLMEEIDACGQAPRVIQIRNEIRRSKAIQALLGGVHDGVRRMPAMSTEDFEELWAERKLERESYDGAMALSPFAEGIRKRTTREFFEHLKTVPAKEGFVAVASHAMATMMERIERRQAEKDPKIALVDMEVLAGMRTAINANRKHAERNLALMAQKPSSRPPGSPPVTVLNSAVLWTIGDIFQALARIDYVDVLARRVGDDQFARRRQALADEAANDAHRVPAP